MVRYFFALVGVSLFARVSPGESSSTEKNWQRYTDHEYQLTIRFPQSWKTDPANRDRPYFRGSDGYFQLLASEGDSPSQVCQNDAAHHLQPYGSHPKIRSMKIDGQKACLIWPSEDSPSRITNPDAEIAVKLSRPVSIGGTQYGQLILVSDENHIIQMARTLRFLRSN